ncbi:MAG: hypothetical protein AAGJ55_12285, partial [Cyanobacteria bacterium J06555_12]
MSRLSRSGRGRADWVEVGWCVFDECRGFGDRPLFENSVLSNVLRLLVPARAELARSRALDDGCDGLGDFAELEDLAGLGDVAGLAEGCAADGDT